MNEEKDHRPEDGTAPAPADDATVRVPGDPAPPSNSDDEFPPPAPPPRDGTTSPLGAAGTPPGEADAPPVGGAAPPPPPGGTGFPPPPPRPEPPFGGAGFPPPGGFPPPPPGTAGWATRYGLVRPRQGRMLAGVCAAIGRATNTDPVLWRVLFAVLTLAGGVSVLVYVVVWLMIPSEGDTGSPLEALLGRGRSSTSPALVVIVALFAMLAVGSVVFGKVRPWLVVVALIAAAVLLVNRNSLHRSAASGGTSGAAPPPAYSPPTSYPAPTSYTPSAAYTPPASDPPPAAPFPPSATTPPPATESTGYRPPFAPHGPYASSPYPYPGLGAPPAPRKPPREPSRLGRFTLSLGLLAMGLLGLIDIATDARIPFGGYVALALAVVGLGLLIGAWFGRTRGLIVLGVVLSVVLISNSAVGDVGSLHGSAGDVTWAPVTIAELDDRYDHSLGNADLDLSALNFDGQDRIVKVKVGAGNLRVELPPKVDVVVSARVGVGNANILGDHWDGLNNPRHTITDNDTDGVGPGKLTLDLTINAGNLEVSR